MNESSHEPARKPARKTTRRSSSQSSRKQAAEAAAKRQFWLRGLYMLFMLLALNLGGTLLAIIAVIQFVLVLLNGTPNEQLVTLGRNLGSYLRQITLFLTYATEEVPFPFSEWPAD